MELTQHSIATNDDWVAARKELLLKEKEFSRLGDELAKQRRALPWEPVEKTYVFQGPSGQETFAQLFAGRSQLAVYHFMLGPDWEAGCPGCSFWADSFNGIDAHIAQRDVTFVAISRGPLEKLEQFKRRMGWNFKWVSSGEGDFNYDYNVSFRPEVLANGEATYNYSSKHNGKPINSPELPGMSAFYKDPAGAIFHTYSTYGRGLDRLNAAYQWLDLMPKGRDEDGLPSPMAWVRHHDRYTNLTQIAT